jgi:hypothetical protein
MRLNVHAWLVVLFVSLSVSGVAQYRKMGGVTLVSAEFGPQEESGIPPLKRIAANWICLTPFAYMDGKNDPEIHYEVDRNWWGDYRENMVSVIADARKYGFKLMLKPHFWVEGSGWAGQLAFDEEGWQTWERNYTDFVLKMARFAEEHRFELFCFGVELKSAVKNRPDFFIQLIDKIRAVYSGKLLYAANWDDFHRIPFWDQLDYIGVDAYFPVTETVTPSVEEVRTIWREFVLQMKDFSYKKRKQIILTEYGYRSIDKPVWKQWEIEWVSDSLNVNLQAQVNSYEGLFQAIWDEPWLAGGFLWKWYPEKIHYTGLRANSDYTPQDKPAEAIIRKWYGKVYHHKPKSKTKKRNYFSTNGLF